VTEPGAHCDDPSNLWLVKTTGEKTQLDSGLSSVNAVAITPNHTMMLAAEKTTQWIYVYAIQPDGTVQDKQRFYWLHQTDIPNNSGTEDMCFDTNGSLYAATNMGIQVCDQNGRVRAILPLPTPCGPITSVCFGGPNFDTLYATDGHQVWMRKMASKGFAPWSPSIQVKSEGAG
jgi:sugar lactone lactonase YvrE